MALTGLLQLIKGHPEFELSEAILDQAFTVELWYKFSYVGWTDWAPLINISNTIIMNNINNH